MGKPCGQLTEVEVEERASMTTPPWLWWSATPTSKMFCRLLWAENDFSRIAPQCVSVGSSWRWWWAWPLREDTPPSLPSMWAWASEGVEEEQGEASREKFQVRGRGRHRI